MQFFITHPQKKGKRSKEQKALAYIGSKQNISLNCFLVPFAA